MVVSLAVSLWLDVRNRAPEAEADAGIAVSDMRLQRKERVMVDSPNPKPEAQ